MTEGSPPPIEINPYQAPQAEVDERPVGEPAAPAGQPTRLMVEHLRGTGPWVLFLAIIGFIYSAFMGLSGLTSLVLVPFMGAFGDTVPGGSAVFVFTAVFYVGGALGMALVSWHMVRFYQAILRAGRSKGADDVGDAVTAQQRLWKVIGITTIVSVAGGFLLGIAFSVLAVTMTTGAFGF